MEKKGIRCSYAVLVIILFAALAFVVDYAYIQNKMHKCDCTDCYTTINTNAGENNNSMTNQVSLRTYRFFGYSVSDGPDMYTTMKLYSNGEYELYINKCSFIDKLSGNYSETDDNITLIGDNDIVITKKDNGNSLDLVTGLNNANLHICNVTSGNFMLEDYMLNMQPTSVVD